MNERAPSSFLLRERSPIVPMTQLGTRGAAQTSASPKSISKQILVSKGTLSGDRDTCYFSNAACPRVANNCLAPRKEQTHAGEAGVPAPLPRSSCPGIFWKCPSRYTPTYTCNQPGGLRFPFPTKQRTMENRWAIRSPTEEDAPVVVALAAPPCELMPAELTSR